MGLGGCVIGSYSTLANKEVCEEAARKNCGVCSRGDDIQTLCKHREDGGFQYFLRVVIPITRPQTGGEGGRFKDKQCLLF